MERHPDSALRLHQEYGARPMAPPAQDQGGAGGTEGDYYNNNSKPAHTKARGTQPPTPPTKRKSGATSGTSTCTSVLLVPSIQSRHTKKAVKNPLSADRAIHRTSVVTDDSDIRTIRWGSLQNYDSDVKGSNGKWG